MEAPKIIILCGGRGKRLRPLTSRLPKPLVPLKDKPILQHIMEFYIGKGFHEFILCTGFCAKSIEEFISSKKFDANIEISNAGENASILKRIYHTRYLINKKAIVTYGDTFINIDPYNVLEQHDKSNAYMTITVTDIQSPFGLVKLTEDNSVVSFDEKPVFSYYIGHMVIENSMLDNIDENLLTLPDGEGLVTLFKKLIRMKKLNAYKHTGLQITFNTFYERKKAEEEIIKFFTQTEEQ